MSEDSLSSQTYGRLKAEIISCALKPGQSVTEAELAARYRVSKSPIRFALALLAAESLVVVAPRRGIQIAPLTLSEMQSTFALRGLLEPYAAVLAADHRTDDQVTELRDLLDAARGDGRSPLSRDQLHAHTHFHIKLAYASGSPQLGRLVQTLQENLERLFNATPALGKTIHFGDSDNDMLAAVSAGDGRKAEILAREGIARTAETTTRLLLGTGHGRG